MYVPVPTRACVYKFITLRFLISLYENYQGHGRILFNTFLRADALAAEGNICVRGYAAPRRMRKARASGAFLTRVVARFDLGLGVLQ